MEIKHGKLFINGELYEPKIKPPTTNQILGVNESINKELSKISFTKSELVKEKGSTTVADATDVSSFQDIYNAYLRIKMLHARATHVVCAFRLDDTSNPYCQHYAGEEDAC